MPSLEGTFSLSRHGFLVVIVYGPRRITQSFTYVLSIEEALMRLSFSELPLSTTVNLLHLTRKEGRLMCFFKAASRLLCLTKIMNQLFRVGATQYTQFVGEATFTFRALCPKAYICRSPFVALSTFQTMEEALLLAPYRPDYKKVFGASGIIGVELHHHRHHIARKEAT